MYQFLTKHGQLAAFGLGLLVAVIFLISVTGGISDFDALPKEEKGTTTIFNFGLVAAIALTIFCFVAAVGFGIWHLIQHPKGSLKMILGLVGILVIFGVFYASAQDETSGKLFELVQTNNISSGQNKFITGSLWTGVVLAILAAGTFVVSEVRNLFK
jgi:hypothetical protein